MFTLTFSHIVDGKRVPLVLNGKEASIQVDAPDKTSAIYHADSVKFCEEHGCTVGGVR